jgi:hypothetical protein
LRVPFEVRRSARTSDLTSLRTVGDDTVTTKEHTRD